MSHVVLGFGLSGSNGEYFRCGGGEDVMKCNFVSKIMLEKLG